MGPNAKLLPHNTDMSELASVETEIAVIAVELTAPAPLKKCPAPSRPQPIYQTLCGEAKNAVISDGAYPHVRYASLNAQPPPSPYTHPLTTT